MNLGCPQPVLQCGGTRDVCHYLLLDAFTSITIICGPYSSYDFKNPEVWLSCSLFFSSQYTPLA